MRLGLGSTLTRRFAPPFDAAAGRPERFPNACPRAGGERRGRPDHRCKARRTGERLRLFEATGQYDRHLRTAFDAAGVAYARVNPSRARDFAKAAGFLAKTDAVDARMLAMMGQALAPKPTPCSSAASEALASLHKRGDQLVATRAAEKARLSETADTGGSLQAHIEWLDAEIVRLDALIADAIATDAELSAKDRLLRSVPGVGPVTAVTLMALMPELGSLNPKAVAALAGLAPFNADSGQFRGVRRIAGGRRRVRTALYMAALVASRSSRHFKGLYQNLRNKGKPAKLAITAIARKLIVMLNAMMRDNQPFRA